MKKRSSAPKKQDNFSAFFKVNSKKIYLIIAWRVAVSTRSAGSEQIFVARALTMENFPELFLYTPRNINNPLKKTTGETFFKARCSLDIFTLHKKQYKF